MKNKNLIMLAGILGILIIIYLVQQLNTGRKSVSESMIEILPDFNSSSVAGIKVYKQNFPDSGLSFTKKDGAWIISSYFGAPAKESEMEKLLTDINALQGEIRSVNPDLFADYEIADDVALHLEFNSSDDSEIAHLLIGKGVPQASRASFVRKFNTDTVYKANENFLSRFAVWNAEPSKKMPAKRWAELKMANFDKEKAGKIELKLKKKNYLFEKQQEIVKEDTIETTKDVWKQVKPSKGKKLDEKAITGILNQISNFRGSEILGDDVLKEHRLTKPSYIANVITEDGVKSSFIFGAETDTTGNARYAMIEGKPYIYKVAKYGFESVFVKPFEKE